MTHSTILSKENKTKKTEKTKKRKGKSTDYTFDNTASLWNQLRIAWREYHLLKKKPDRSSDEQLQEFRILIGNLLDELGFEKSSSNEFFGVTIEDVPDLEFSYSDKDEGKKSS